MTGRPLPDSHSSQAHQAIAGFCASRSCAEIEQLAAQFDLPLLAMAD